MILYIQLRIFELNFLYVKYDYYILNLKIESAFGIQLIITKIKFVQESME